MSLLEQKLFQLATFLEAEIKRQLIDDEHRASGKLVDSIKNIVSQGADSFTIEGEMLIYGGAIISGRRAGTKRIPVDALIEYLNNLNFSSDVKRTRGVAFHIQKRIFEEGIEEDDFLDKVFDQNEQKIESDIFEATEQDLTIALNNLITQAQQFA